MIEKTKINESEDVVGPFLKKVMLSVSYFMLNVDSSKYTFVHQGKN